MSVTFEDDITHVDEEEEEEYEEEKEQNFPSESPKPTQSLKKLRVRNRFVSQRVSET